MEKIHFSIFIKAPKEKVWNIMFDADTYNKWTKPFNPKSHYIGDWSEGSKMLFLGSDEDGDGMGGMVSRIKKNIMYKFISIEHIGIVKNSKEDTTSDEVKKWTPSFENYTFSEKKGGMQVSIEMDVIEEYKSMFEEMWPKSLQELKKLAEKK